MGKRDKGLMGDSTPDVLEEFLKKKPTEGEELLELVLEAGRISRSASSLRLQVSGEVIDSWCETLKEEGWLKPLDRDLDDPIFELSELALKKLRRLERDFIEQVEENEPEKIVSRKRKRSLPFMQFSVIDFLVFTSLILSYVMFQNYSENLGNNVYPILGLFLILFAVIVYKTSVQYSITRMIILRFFQTRRILFLALVTNIRHVISATLIVFMIYFAGKLILTKSLIYLGAAIICLTMVPVVYQKRGTKLALLRFYIGLCLTIYSMLLLFGLRSITELVYNKIRLLDILSGVALLFYLKVKEEYFGLKTISLRKFLRSQKADSTQLFD
ncbi:MAG: hypothetical protein ABH851_08075 [Methanobacteriota archaeon]